MDEIRWEMLSTYFPIDVLPTIKNMKAKMNEINISDVLSETTSFEMMFSN